MFGKLPTLASSALPLSLQINSYKSIRYGIKGTASFFINPLSGTVVLNKPEPINLNYEKISYSIMVVVKTR